MSELETIKSEAISELAACNDLRVLEDLRVKYAGKKGLITAQMAKIATLPNEEKKAFGALVNEVKQSFESALDAKKSALETADLNNRLATEKLDLTLPTRPQAQGSIHPISQVMDELSAILSGLGFELHDGPNIEDDWHNFTALNIPESHPARQMHDTFYLPPSPPLNPLPEREGKSLPPFGGEVGGGIRLLRTHTSNTQIHGMTNATPPFRHFSMGRTYRSDSDQTHTPMFHQVEAVYVDKKVNFGQLKWAVEEFINQFFGEKLEMQLRPSYFPFTEPSAEVDIRWGKDRWLEIMGCGMINPNVLRNCKIDPEIYTGFAFGAGIERMAMLKYNINDLRQFFESDVRWLKHYGF